MLSDSDIKTKLLQIRGLCADVVEELNRRENKTYSFKKWKEGEK